MHSVNKKKRKREKEREKRDERKLGIRVFRWMAHLRCIRTLI
jgi:hypothetical protein